VTPFENVPPTTCATSQARRRLDLRAVVNSRIYRRKARAAGRSLHSQHERVTDRPSTPRMSNAHALSFTVMAP